MPLFDADRHIEEHALVKLQHGSVINWRDLMLIDKELKEMDARLMRARRLAAHLEEVVSMQRALIKAVADWDPDVRPQQTIAWCAWAKALMSEVP